MHATRASTLVGAAAANVGARSTRAIDQSIAIAIASRQRARVRCAHSQLLGSAYECRPDQMCDALTRVSLIWYHTCERRATPTVAARRRRHAVADGVPAEVVASGRERQKPRSPAAAVGAQICRHRLRRFLSLQRHLCVCHHAPAATALSPRCRALREGFPLRPRARSCRKPREPQWRTAAGSARRSPSPVVIAAARGVRRPAARRGAAAVVAAGVAARRRCCSRAAARAALHVTQRAVLERCTWASSRRAARTPTGAAPTSGVRHLASTTLRRYAGRGAQAIGGRVARVHTSATPRKRTHVVRNRPSGDRTTRVAVVLRLRLRSRSSEPARRVRHPARKFYVRPCRVITLPALAVDGHTA